MIHIWYCQECKWVYPEISAETVAMANECPNGHEGKIFFIKGEETTHAEQIANFIIKNEITENVLKLAPDPRLDKILELIKNPIVVHCIICHSGWTAEQMDGASCCAKCKTTAMPLPVSGDLTIETNWLEMMILIEYAEHFGNMVRQSSKANNDMPLSIIGAIAGRWAKYRPPKGKALLTAERMREAGNEAPRIMVPAGVGGKRLN